MRTRPRYRRQSASVTASALSVWLWCEVARYVWLRSVRPKVLHGWLDIGGRSCHPTPPCPSRDGRRGRLHEAYCCPALPHLNDLCTVWLIRRLVSSVIPLYTFPRFSPIMISSPSCQSRMRFVTGHSCVPFFAHGLSCHAGQILLFPPLTFTASLHASFEHSARSPIRCQRHHRRRPRRNPTLSCRPSYDSPYAVSPLLDALTFVFD